jgi:glycosyltransferase involved in cell wall biosynthesis
MTTISVVIPCYNDAPFLAVCLAALAAQNRPADEIIVVDNASTDASVAVARAAGARVITAPTHGIWPAASTGFDAAVGEVIARLDADSIPPVDWLAKIETTLTASPEVDVITGPGDFYDCSATLAWLGRVAYIGGYFWAIGLWLARPPVFGSNFAMRRAVWREVGALVHRDRSDVHDDLDLSLHLGPSIRVAYQRTLRVGISARPFQSWAGLMRRLDWAVRTLSLHWPEGSPWRIRAARRAWRARADALPPGSDRPRHRPA